MVSFTDSPFSGDGLPPELERLGADAGVIDAIVAADRMIASITAAKLGLIRFAHETQVGAMAHALAQREFRAELATTLRISERGADRLITEADALVRHLPATHAALAEGHITPRQAAIVADELALVDAEQRPDLERRALASAQQSATAFARTIRRLRETRDAEHAAERHRAARDDRHVSRQPDCDGMQWLIAKLPAADAIAIDSRLDDLARGLARDGDERTMAQLRADAFGDVLLDRDSRAFRRFGDARPTVIVTVPISVLAGSNSETAELHGHGPIDAETARQLTADAPVLRRMLTDPRDDSMIALDRTRYRVTDDLRLYLAVRDERCRFPWCNRPAVASDVDHSVAWADGGATDADNLAHLCRGHHTVKHETRWRIEARHPDGSIDWLSPTGRRHRTRPARTVSTESAGADPPEPVPRT